MNLPWPAPAENHSHDDRQELCPLLAQLSEPLREVAVETPHLFRYLHAIPIEQLGLPEYRAELSYQPRKVPGLNIIYPVGGGGYVHVCSDPEDAYDHYISIEPSFGIELGFVSEIERRLIAYLESLDRATSDDELAQALSKAVEDSFPVQHRSRREGSNRQGPLERESGEPDAPVAAGADELEAAKYTIIRDKVRGGVLEPLLQDPHVETISCSGVGRLFLEHRIFGSLKTSFAFESSEELDDFVLRVSQKVGKPITDRIPIVDAVLPDGARINIVFGRQISRRGTNFTISKSPSTPMSILNLVEFGTLDYTIAAYLSLVVSEGMNIFICGEGGSGKTALLNASSSFLSPDAKIVSIEDTPELRVPHRNWIREVVREGSAGQANSDVTVFSLLKAALRQRPNAIILGEIRGAEGNIAFQAMQTGHQVMSTIHASSVEKLIQRLTGIPINVPKPYIDNLNVALVISIVRLPNGELARRVVSVSEIVNYDSQSNSFSFVEVIRWNGEKDNFEFIPASFLMETTISFRRGLPRGNKKAIYDELTRRKVLFEKLHSRTSGFFELYEILSKAQKEGLL